MRVRGESLLRTFSLTEEARDNIISKLRPSQTIDPKVEGLVKKILDDVAARGDNALVEFTKEFDKVETRSSELRVKDKEIEDAYSKVSRNFIVTVKKLKLRIETLENKILGKLSGNLINENGLKIQSVTRPIGSVGCYIPGGRALYPSSVVMTTTPAKVAGVRRVVVTSPPNKRNQIDSSLLVAADICEVEEVYKVGGAQAIAALAYGTKTIPKVDKIVGPGNVYVTIAKILVSRFVDIDMPAGPTELLILADESADPKLVALDMVSQAEHGGESMCGLVSTETTLLNDVKNELASLVDNVGRSEYVRTALSNNGFAVKVDAIQDGIYFVNQFAPEHLQIMCRDPEKVAEEITSAGLILLGQYSPSAASDYSVGTNHVLPTSGSAKRRSGLSSTDFIKRINIVKCTRSALENISPMVKTLAEAEGLLNHWEAVRWRLKDE